MKRTSIIRLLNSSKLVSKSIRGVSTLIAAPPKAMTSKNHIITSSLSNRYTPITTSIRLHHNCIAVTDDCLSLSLSEVSQQLAQGKITSTALVEACLRQLEAMKHTNAYVSVLAESAREQAAASDARRQNNASLGPLDGVPIAVKDNFCVQGTLTTASSNVLGNFVAPYNATVVQRLLDQGAVIIGKTNMDEFGMGSYGLHSHVGPVVSPLTATPRTVGGSSSGSAAALAAHTCFAAIGSDTGGSVRLPASYTGTVGLKPTYGLLSRYGLIAYGSSLDCPGIIAKNTQDARIVLNAIAGADEQDSTCVFSLPSRSDSARTTTDKPSLSGVRVGIPRELMFADLPATVKQAWDATAQLLRAEGAEIVSVSVPALEHAISVYYTIASAESVSNLSRYDGVRYGQSTYTAQLHKTFSAAKANEEKTEDASKQDKMKKSALQELYSKNRSTFFGPEVQRRITIGNFVLSSAHYNSYVGKAMEIRAALTEQLTSLLSSNQPTTQSQVDVLLFPSATSTAPSFTALQRKAETDVVSAYIDDVMTVFANLAGLPAVSVPVQNVLDTNGDTQDILPLGMQLMGSALSEHKLLDIAGIVNTTYVQECQH